MKNYKPEIRMDDVLQLTGLSKNQEKNMGGKPLFKLFLEADEMFKKYDYPCTLAICADGINAYPGWVEYIKNNIHRYKIGLHCWHHQNYKFQTREFILN